MENFKITKVNKPGKFAPIEVGLLQNQNKPGVLVN